MSQIVMGYTRLLLNGSHCSTVLQSGFSKGDVSGFHEFLYWQVTQFGVKPTMRVIRRKVQKGVLAYR